jgi:ribosomal protein S27E
MLWFIKSKWEFHVRSIDFFWLIILMTILLPTGGSPGLFTVFCIQFVLLIWPKPYFFDDSEQVEEEIDNDENFVRLKCGNCGATYTYNSKAISNNEIVCQNCGKRVET